MLQRSPVVDGRRDDTGTFAMLKTKGSQRWKQAAIEPLTLLAFVGQQLR